MSGTVLLRAVTLESLQIPIVASVDPTGGQVAFALSAPGASSPGTYSSGQWSGSWDASTGRAVAITPLIGAAGTLPIAAGSGYDLWVKVSSIGSETPQWVVGRINAA